MHEIVHIDQVEKFIEDLRKKSDITIAFTNGCFDILHRGHVHYLESAKEPADILVVGLNSDSSVTKLKGVDRPYVKEDDRAFILTRLESVDIVVVFDEDTPIELLKRVKPDLLIKGGDYSIDQVVGKDLVESYGGKVYVAPLVKGLSSTNIITKIQNENRGNTP
jgi:rfaE bifunctional protein nucleotidyltransferase chain/domain